MKGRRAVLPFIRTTLAILPKAKASSQGEIRAYLAGILNDLGSPPLQVGPETQEMLDFCGAHNITADVEVIPIQKVNEAYERLLKPDVKYRFSIDRASLRAE
ncbi:MAG TPA: hypothetical protein VMN36_11355 [Verrucomicrobiales bacterium]|nr:hypothetical protein [Verrucomicrobiales bacterium]